MESQINKLFNYALTFKFGSFYASDCGSIRSINRYLISDVCLKLIGVQGGTL